MIWITGKTRPDLASALSMVASIVAFNPKEAFDMIKGIGQYIVFTHDMALNYGKHEEQGMRVETDASFAPTGDRPRTGIVVYWRGNLFLAFVQPKYGHPQHGRGRDGSHGTRVKTWTCNT